MGSNISYPTGKPPMKACKHMASDGKRWCDKRFGHKGAHHYVSMHKVTITPPLLPWHKR